MIEWKDVPGYNGYQATRCGRVRSVDRIIVYSDGTRMPHKGRELKPVLSPYGYQTFCIKKRSVMCHRMIAMTFIPNPNNKPFVNHINAIKTDNRVENLEWCTREENELHAMENGLKNSMPGSLNPSAKLSEASVRKILQLIDSGIMQKDLAKMYGVSTATICLIKKGINWPTVTNGKN